MMETSLFQSRGKEYSLTQREKYQQLTLSSQMAILTRYQEVNNAVPGKY